MKLRVVIILFTLQLWIIQAAFLLTDIAPSSNNTLAAADVSNYGTVDRYLCLRYLVHLRGGYQSKAFPEQPLTR